MKELTKLIGLLVYIFGIIFLDGYVVMKTWNWNVVPTLSLPELGLRAAMGLSIMWTAFAFRPRLQEKGKELQRGVEHVLGLLLLLLAAYGISHWWM
jgi:hypothetical protein